MKIAIITLRIFFVPANQGGAVENLIDSYLEYYDKHKIYDITLYSIYHPNVNNKSVYDGMDNKKFNPSRTPINRMSMFFCDNDYFVVFILCRLILGKGIQEILVAMELLQEDTSIKLLVVVGVNFSDTANSNTFFTERKVIANRKSYKDVFTGVIPYTHLPRHIASVNVVVVPSIMNEALGMPCIEAYATGLPVIATNDGGIPEKLEGRKHNIVNKGKDHPQQLASLLLEIKSNYEEYRGNTPKSFFTKEAYSEKFFESLKQID